MVRVSVVALKMQMVCCRFLISVHIYPLLRMRSFRVARGLRVEGGSLGDMVLVLSSKIVRFSLMPLNFYANVPGTRRNRGNRSTCMDIRKIS